MKTFKHFLFLCAILTLSVGFVSGQADETAIPPQVIAVTPFPGEEIPQDAPLVVTFNQAMDQSSVEAAWSLEPALNGGFNWSDDRNLAFTPNSGWPVGGEFRLSIDQTAVATNGATLPDPFEADLRAAGALMVSSVIPGEGAEGVAADATITVAFNRPVVPLVYTGEIANLPDPLTLSPAVTGKGEWLNTSIYQFEPDQALDGGTTYTVTVNAGLTAVSGALLENDYMYSFTTLIPEILSTSPNEGQTINLESPFSVTFSQPMDQTATAESFSLFRSGEPVSGAKSWSEDGRILTFTPAERLPINTEFQFVVDASLARGTGGAPLRQGRDFRVQTVPLPFVEWTSPSNGDTNVSPGFRRVNIHFGTPMNTDTFEGRYTVSPEPEEVTPVVFGNRDLSLEFEFKQNTTYTVTLLAGTEDLYGNAIENDYTFSFSVGEVAPSVYLYDEWRHVITGAYRQDTFIAASVTGDPVVDFTLYKIPIAEMSSTYGGMSTSQANELAREGEEIRAWTESLGQDTVFANAKVQLASETGGALELGTYLVRSIFDPRNPLQRIVRPRDMRISFVLLSVANTNITAKRMEDELLVWVTDMETGEPLVEQQIAIYELNQDVPSVTAFTDGDGVARITEPLGNELTIVVESDTRYGVWYQRGTPRTPEDSLYLYTDRPLYRPGETLYFKGAYRARDDFNYTVTAEDTLDVVIRDMRGEELLNGITTLTEFGTFSGNVQLPETAAVGSVSITINKDGRAIGGTSAQIAEFRVPEFQVSVEAAQDEIIRNEPIQAIARGTFFSGGVVSNADVSWFASATPTSFDYTGPGRYTFSNQTGYNYIYYEDFHRFQSSRNIASGEGTTDGNGEFLVAIDDVQTQGNSPENVTVEASMTDESGQFISGRTSVTVHPSEVYVGIRSDRYFARAGEAFDAEVITVMTDSTPVSEHNVTLTLVERRWEREEIEGQFGRYNWVQNEIEVETVRVTTDVQGVASHSFIPPNAGIFIIRASILDRLERTHESALQLWVTGTGRVWWGQPTNNIDMIADKENYVPGETAEVLVPISLEGVSWVLMAVERDGVVTHEVVRVEGSTLVYELPIDQAYEPGIFLTAMVIHGIDGDNSVPTYRQGTLRLDVEPVSKRLDITITPSTSNAQPGETVTLDIAVTDPDGNPVQAEFGLALVDEAILSLSSPNSVDPETHFYSRISNYTFTEIMMTALIDGTLDDIFGQEQEAQSADIDEAEADDGVMMEMEDMALAAPSPAPTMMAAGEARSANAAFEEVTVREDFQQTPLWEAHIVTDANGNAQISVVMPDNLTIWDLTARAVTTDTLVGDLNLDIASTLPLLVRPAAPRFFTVGDEVTLAMVVNNNSDEVQNVDVTMRGTGFELMPGVEQDQTGQIEANSRMRFDWRVSIPDVPSVDLTFFAIGNDGFEDASKPPLTQADGTIPVYRYTAPDTVGTAGVLREGGVRTEGISVPPIADTDQGTLSVQLDPSLAVTTIDSLDYLRNFEHQCIEQTVSRFLPNVMTVRALQSLGVRDEELEASLREAVEFAMKRLTAAQNFDGGWGWFTGMDSNPLVTAYAVMGLIEAREIGFDVSVDMIDRGVAFLRANFINPTEDTVMWELNRQAFYFFVLTRADDGRYDPAVSELDALFRVRLEMNYDALSYLTMAYHGLQQRSTDTSAQIQALTSDLISGARLSATGAHWEEARRDWWNWGSEVRSTALALSALIRVDPQNELLPNAVRWLMVAREGKHWATTQETAWSIMGLTDWMVATNELDGNYDYQLVLNSEERASGTVTPETVREGREMVFAVGELLLDEINRLSVIRSEGEGALYYTTHLRLQLDASEVDAIDRGVGVTREYLMDGEPVTDIEMGDIVTVRLTLTIPDTMYYFVLEDPLPAGLEALDTSLLTTTQAVEGPRLRPGRDPYYYWWWWIWDHTEIRDESVNLYADRLSPGTYVYSYQAQATVPGSFQTRPAHGYAFYFPEVFGRSDGTLFTIMDSGDE